VNVGNVSRVKQEIICAKILLKRRRQRTLIDFANSSDQLQLGDYEDYDCLVEKVIKTHTVLSAVLLLTPYGRCWRRRNGISYYVLRMDERDFEC
jgi:hypothetical protein